MQSVHFYKLVETASQVKSIVETTSITIMNGEQEGCLCMQSNCTNLFDNQKLHCRGKCANTLLKMCMHLASWWILFK